jgi:predicted RNA-binding Zn-ribbon protein involved in translation (DUF1610 family)
MEFAVLQSFTNYMDAHILMGKLEEEGIRCWLKDENTLTIDPILTNALGGIKLMVTKEQYERALSIVQEMQAEKRKKYTCPQCGSSDIEYIVTPRKLSNWLGAIGGFLFGDLAIGIKKTWRCFHCQAEFEEPREQDHS